MPSKRPFGDEENNQIQSKKAKMVRAIKACMKNKPVVKLTKIDDKINQKKLLFEAIKSQDVTGVQDLLKIKVDVNIQNRHGSTPLHVAAYLGHFDIVKILVNNGANIFATNFKNEAPLHTAISKGHYTISKYLLINGAVVHFDNEEYHDLVMLAVKNCQVDLVKLLLFYDAGINFEYEIESFLQLAIKNQSLEIMQLLLENGVDPNYSYNPYNPNGAHPVADLALETRNWDIINMLLNYGIEDIEGPIFLKQAIYSSNNIANVEMLLKNGVEADISVLRDDRALALSESNTREILNLLIGFGANVNYQDEDLQTPLHYATEYENYKLLKVLMQNGANPNLKDDVGESSIEKTLQYKSTNYFKAILYNQSYY